MKSLGDRMKETCFPADPIVPRIPPTPDQVKWLIARVRELEAQHAAAVCAWEEYSKWPDLPQVPVGKIIHPDGTAENVALRADQITGILRGIEKHVRECLPFGVSAVKAMQDAPIMKARLEQLSRKVRIYESALELLSTECNGIAKKALEEARDDRS